MEDKSVNVDTLTEDIANIEVDVDSSILQIFAKFIWRSRGVKTKIVQTDTQKFVDSGRKVTQDAKAKITAIFFMILLHKMKGVMEGRMKNRNINV